MPAVYGVVRWCLIDLTQREGFCITISKQTLSGELRALGYHSDLTGSIWTGLTERINLD